MKSVVKDKPAGTASKSVRKTEEQKQCIAKFMTGGDLVIQAGAGAGKTSTLVMMAEATTRRGVYTAFNKALVEDARGKFPSNVAVSTMHSLAYRSTMNETRKKKLAAPRISMAALAIRLRLHSNQPYEAARGDVSVILSPRQQAFLVKMAIERFCQSGDKKVGPESFPWQKTLTPAANASLRADLLPAATEMWKDLRSDTGNLPWGASIGHTIYLKIFELNEPVIDAEFIMVDEAQDLNPVLISIVMKQSDTQKVFVGDNNQQIYEWMGAVNALQKLGIKNRATLSQSFRFNQRIADVANDVLFHIPGDQLHIRGFGEGDDESVSEIATPNAVLTRTNAAAIQALMEGQKRGTAVHVVGGGKDVISFCYAAADLQDKESPVEHPELACFANWREVQEYVADGGDDLKLMVKLIDRFGARAIAYAFHHMPPEDKADIIYSTAHKAKGREWDQVKLSPDFIVAKRCECEHTVKQHTDDGKGLCYADDCECNRFTPAPPQPAELRLLYVAVTRAKKRLDPGLLRISRDGIDVVDAVKEDC